MFASPETRFSANSAVVQVGPHTKVELTQAEGESAEAPIVLRALAFALQDVNQHVALVIDRRGEQSQALAPGDESHEREDESSTNGAFVSKNLAADTRRRSTWMTVRAVLEALPRAGRLFRSAGSA